MSTYVSHLHMVIIGSKQEELCKLEPPGMCSESNCSSSKVCDQDEETSGCLCELGLRWQQRDVARGFEFKFLGFWIVGCRYGIGFRHHVVR